MVDGSESNTNSNNISSENSMSLSTSETMGPNVPQCSALILGQHGVLVIAPSIGLAIDRMFYLERSCRQWVECFKIGKPLQIMEKDVAEVTAKQWEDQENIYSVMTIKEVMKTC